MRRALTLMLTLCLCSFSLAAQAFESNARFAMVIDATTGAELLSKNADQPMPPASMSKLMTLYMVFTALDEGRLSLADTLPVSEKAWKMQGSRMFLEPRHKPTVMELIRGIIVHSGNDACVVLAEGLAGTEEAFAARMTQKARAMGMSNSSFANATGWPHPGQRMSAKDLVMLAQRLMDDFPQYYPFFAEQEFTWDGITQRNRNPLLYLDIGADGLKTGHTEEAGYGLVGSATRNGRRVIFVVSGLDSVKARSDEAQRITSWAFRDFSNVKLFDANENVAQADIWIGAERSVAMAPPKDVITTLPIAQRDAVKIKVNFTGPVPAPVAKGDEIGTMVISVPNMPDISVPLYAASDVAEGGFLTRATAAFQTLSRDLLGLGG